MRVAVCILSMFVATAAHAQLAIKLDPMAGETDLDVVETQNYTGSCGGSIVRVLGVKSGGGSTFTSEPDAGRIIVRDGPNHEIEIAMDDLNGLACVKSAKGPRLVVWSLCGGTACGDRFAFEIYDPKSLARLTPDPKKDRCDAACASRVLGSRFPFSIRRE